MQWPAAYDPANDLDGIQRNPGNIYIPYSSFLQCCVVNEDTLSQQCRNEFMRPVTDAICIKVLHTHARMMETPHTTPAFFSKPHAVTDVSLPFVESDLHRLQSEPYSVCAVSPPGTTCGLYMFRVTCSHGFKDTTCTAESQCEADTHPKLKKRKVQPTPCSISELLQGMTEPRLPIKPPTHVDVQYICCMLLDGHFFYLDKLQFLPRNYPAFFECSMHSSVSAAASVVSDAAAITERVSITLLDTCFISGRYCGGFARQHRIDICQQFMVLQQQQRRPMLTTDTWTCRQFVMLTTRAFQLEAKTLIPQWWKNMCEGGCETVIYFSPCNRRYTSAYTGEQFKVYLNTSVYSLDAFLFSRLHALQKKGSSTNEELLLYVAVPGRVALNAKTHTATASMVPAAAAAAAAPVAAFMAPAASAAPAAAFAAAPAAASNYVHDVPVQTHEFFEFNAFHIVKNAKVYTSLHGIWCPHWTPRIIDETSNGVHARFIVDTAVSTKQPLITNIEIVHKSPLRHRTYYATAALRLYCQIKSNWSYKALTNMLIQAVHTPTAKQNQAIANDKETANVEKSKCPTMFVNSYWSPECIQSYDMSRVLRNKYDGLSYKHAFLDPFLSSTDLPNNAASLAYISNMPGVNVGINCELGPVDIIPSTEGQRIDKADEIQEHAHNESDSDAEYETHNSAESDAEMEEQD